MVIVSATRLDSVGDAAWVVSRWRLAHALGAILGHSPPGVVLSLALPAPPLTEDARAARDTARRRCRLLLTTPPPPSLFPLYQRSRVLQGETRRVTTQTRDAAEALSRPCAGHSGHTSSTGPLCFQGPELLISP